LAQSVQYGVGITLDPTLGVDQKRDDIGILRAAPGGGDHGRIQPASRLEDTRRIDENDLGRSMGDNAAHQCARRLHLVRDNGNLGADKLVDQRRLAGVRSADEGYEARARFGRRIVGRVTSIGHAAPSPVSHTPSLLSIAAAAASSAALRVPPVAFAGAEPDTCTETVKRGCWSGPSRRSMTYSGRPAPIRATHACSADLGF